MATPPREIAPSWLAPTLAGCGALFLLALTLSASAGVALVWFRFATASPAPAYRGAPAPAPVLLPPPMASPSPMPIPPVQVDDAVRGHLDVAVRVTEARGGSRLREGDVCTLALEMAETDGELRCSGSFRCDARTLWEVAERDGFACDAAPDTGLVVAHDDAGDGSRPALTATYARGEARVTLYRRGSRFLFVAASTPR